MSGHQGLTWWLRKAPKAFKFRLHTPEGARDILVSSLPKARWAAVCELVTGTGATKVEALDEKGGLIRVTDVQADGEPPEDAAPDEGRSAAVAQVDTNAATLQLFAKLLAEAYEKGAKLQQQAMSDLVTALTKRTEELKREKPAGSPASDGGSGLNLESLMQLAQAVPAIQGAIAAVKGQPAPAAPPAPKPNGES
jgi:hypothetical protein